MVKTKQTKLIALVIILLAVILVSILFVLQVPAILAPMPSPVYEGEGCKPLPAKYWIAPGEYFVRDQVILTGVLTEVNIVVNAFRAGYPTPTPTPTPLPTLTTPPTSTPTPTLTRTPIDVESLTVTTYLRGPVETIELGYLRSYTPPSGEFQTFFGDRTPDVVMQLYTIPSSSSVAETVSRIYTISQELVASGRITFGVLADPNYLIGRPPVRKGLGANNPWSVGGDPGMGKNGSAAKTWFKRQWALSDSQMGGIGLFDAGGQSVIPYKGSGVLVGIFDTSPFDRPGQWRTPWLAPEMTLCVFHPASSLDPTLESTVVISDVREHGLFVAGLVHTVAPQSEIHLIRVLNNQGQGHLFGLMDALSTFIDRRLFYNETLANTVINLSLGVHGSDELDLSPDQIQQIRSWITGMSYIPLSQDHLPVMLLETMLHIAHDFDAVIVAASGNDSCCQPAEEAQIPASYSFVIGVAASDYEGKRSCFSNIGDVAAPGGQGIGNCEPSLHLCQDDCPYGLIGLVLGDTSPTGYAYWAGTSFSTPLVSGLVALFFEKHGGVGGASITAMDMKDITCPSSDAGLGTGIINLPHALLGAPCPTSTPTAIPTPTPTSTPTPTP